jgi:hypothetical protein
VNAKSRGRISGRQIANFSNVAAIDNFDDDKPLTRRYNLTYVRTKHLRVADLSPLELMQNQGMQAPEPVVN